MANEFGNLGDGLDIGGAPREDVNKVTEEAVRRIQDEAKQAQQAQQDIKKDKKTNTKIAAFLTFLLKTLKNDQLISLLYELFFKIKDKKTGTSYIRKKINTIVIIGFFYPFYITEANKLGISGLFESLIGNEPLNLTGYINYIKKLSMTYHDNVPLESNLLMEFLINIVDYFKLYDIPSLTAEQRNNFILHIKNELYS